MGGWQSCSASCGSDGIRKRTVLCVRTVAGEERVLHPGDCRKLPKPKAAVTCNRNVTCGSDWAVGNWSEVRLRGSSGHGVSGSRGQGVMEAQDYGIMRSQVHGFVGTWSCELMDQIITLFYNDYQVTGITESCVDEVCKITESVSHRIMGSLD